MNDASTQRRLEVSTIGTAGPYLWLPVARLAEVRRLLDQHDIRHWGDGFFLSLNGGSEMAVINFGRGADAIAIQAILDEAL